MAWIRVDDKFSHGPKVARAAMQLGGGRKARGRVLAVWLDMVSYCNLNLTDGFVPAYEADGMADAKPLDVIAAMTVSDDRIGPLVESVDGGWQMRNYTDYQPTRAEIETARNRTAERQKAWRERKSNSVTRASVTVMSQVPEPDRPEPDRTEEQVQDQAQKPRRFPQPVENFGLMQKLVHELIHEGVPISERKDELKDRCGKHGIAYDADSIRKALDSVEKRSAVSA